VDARLRLRSSVAGRSPHVRHQAAQIHHAARRSGRVAARGAGAARRTDAAHRGSRDRTCGIILRRDWQRAAENRCERRSSNNEAREHQPLLKLSHSRQFTPLRLPCFRRKNSTPQIRQETAAMRDFNSPYVGLGRSGWRRVGTPPAIGWHQRKFFSIPVTRSRYPDNEQKNRDAQFASKNGQKPKPIG
jgi:hypothetical protein